MSSVNWGATFGMPADDLEISVEKIEEKILR